jgi:hypothetical protein
MNKKMVPKTRGDGCLSASIGDEGDSAIVLFRCRSRAPGDDAGRPNGVQLPASYAAVPNISNLNRDVGCLGPGSSRLLLNMCCDFLESLSMVTNLGGFQEAELSLLI